MKIGILHPGAMGSSLGAALVATGNRVFWVEEGRSLASVSRARADGLQACATLSELAQIADVIFAVCPPHAAVEVSHSVLDEGFQGIYVDANAVSPLTVRQIHSIVQGRMEFVDGGVIGPPARRPNSTRLYLSGASADEIAVLFDGSAVEAHNIDVVPGRASALKMCYAAWTKGTDALMLAIAGLARQEGVESTLGKEWEVSQSRLPAALEAAVNISVPKAWRFAGEMREIAETFEANGLPGGFHQAAADLYQRLSDFKGQASPDRERVFRVLLECGQSEALAPTGEHAAP